MFELPFTPKRNEQVVVKESLDFSSPKPPVCPHIDKNTEQNAIEPMQNVVKIVETPCELTESIPAAPRDLGEITLDATPPTVTLAVTRNNEIRHEINRNEQFVSNFRKVKIY